MLNNARIVRRFILLITLIVFLTAMSQLGLADETMEDARRLDKKAWSIIEQSQLLKQLDAFDEAASDKVCSFAIEYAPSEWIKTQAYKTPFHEDIALTLENLSALYCLCHPPRAEIYLQSVLKIKENLYSEQSAPAASAHDALADYYRLYMMEFKKAIHHYGEARKIRMKLYGNQDPGITENNYPLALTLFYHKGEKEKAESLLSEAIRIRKLSSVNKAFPLYRAQIDAGIFYSMLGSYDQGIAYLTAALKTMDPYSGPDEINIRSELGIIYLNKDDLALSFTHTKNAYETAKALYEKKPTPLILKPLELLTEICSLQGNTQMAEQFETELKLVRQALGTLL